MNDHDEFCQRDEPDHWCECALIAKVRADQDMTGRAAEMERRYDDLTITVARLVRERADLRARAQALPHWQAGLHAPREVVNRADVLALFDGGNDD